MLLLKFSNLMQFSVFVHFTMSWWFFHAYCWWLQAKIDKLIGERQCWKHLGKDLKVKGVFTGLVFKNTFINRHTYFLIFLLHFNHFFGYFLHFLLYLNEILFSVFYLQILWNVSVFRITENLWLYCKGWILFRVHLKNL